MPDDREIARETLDRQAREREFRMFDIPTYKPWSERKLAEGVDDALIANLDARAMWLLPEEVAGVGDADFDEMLQDLKDDLGIS
jgi:hypothetical protein